jgi:hypothetical protein
LLHSNRNLVQQERRLPDRRSGVQKKKGDPHRVYGVHTTCLAFVTRRMLSALGTFLRIFKKN